MTTPRRVLFVAHAYPRFAGDVAGSFLHRLATALLSDGLQVRVVAPSGPGLAHEQELDGVEIVRYRYAHPARETLAYTGTMAEQALAGPRGLLSLVGLLRAGVRAVRHEVTRWHPDVIHAHWWFPGGLQVHLARTGVPWVLTLHGSDVRLIGANPVARWLSGRVLGSARRVTTVSEWLRHRAGHPSARVLPMPVDISTFHPNDVGRDPARFVFAGRLNAQKGLDVALGALSLVAPPATLDVLGDGPWAATLRRDAERLGIASRVRWMGQGSATDLADSFRSATAVLIPSREEGLGLVAVEAQLCGARVIATRSGGLPDVVLPDGGTLVPVDDAEAMAAAMRTMLDGAGGSVPATASGTLLERFSPSAAAHAYRGVYAEALSDG